MLSCYSVSSKHMQKRAIKIDKNGVLKALIAFGLLAILVSLYTQYGKPYMQELTRERSDRTRIKDLDSLDTAMKTLLQSGSSSYIGDAQTIYISIPSDDESCTGIDLPSLPDGWKYHCAKEGSYTKSDGSGWIPVDFKGGLSSLPVDSVNKGEILNYYAYVASSRDEYAVVGALDSKKYLKEKANNDNGIDSFRYEVGNNFVIWMRAYGILGYWPMDDIKNEEVTDETKLNNAKVFGNPVVVKNSNKNSILFSAQNDYLDMQKNYFEEMGNRPFSMSVWFKTEDITNDNGVIGGTYDGNYSGFMIRQNDTGSVLFTQGLGNKKNIDISISSEKEKWNFAVLEYDGNAIKAYVNKKSKKTNLTTGINNLSSVNMIIGRFPWTNAKQMKGEIKNISLFNRSLSQSEIDKLFTSF